MLKITLIRHGKTDGNTKGKFIGVTDEPLLEEEKEELAGLKFPRAEAVYSSPMKRCTETARILFPYEKAVIVPELAERDFGLFEGKTYKELTEEPEYRSWVGNQELISYPEGEELSEFQERCISGLEKIIDDAVKKKKTDIAVIAHGGTIMSILYAYGFPEQEYLEWMVKNAEGYRLRLSPEDFEDGADKKRRKIIVDGKIIRQ
jgi:alpha-ribazole phosphatase